ncbi:MAG: ABC transporter permease [Bacteroidetes bacterium]|nr:ABC transporter permease [Bacteroidota bacterium]
MISYFFKTAWRNLLKNKGYSAINIFGLAVGLATCLVIILYVTDELSYDRFFNNAGRIYRINSDIKFGGAHLRIAETPDMMGELLKKDYPQVEEYTRLYTNEGEKLVKKGSDFISEPRVAYADSTFFRMFNLPAVEGDTKTALDEPNTVVINTTMAKKYFGDGNVMGKTLEIKADAGLEPYKITAVIKDIPGNSHMNFDMLFSMKNANYQWGQLTSHNFRTYIQLREGTDYKAFEKNFPAYIDKYVLPQVKQFMNIGTMADFNKAGNTLDYSLLPLTKIHLYSDFSFEITPPGNIRYVYIFSAVALFILLIACVNFINLSTARSAKRAKEVGIRKTLGTERKTLIAQFLAESVLTVVVSMLIALCIAWLILPFFNEVAGKSITMQQVLNGKILVTIFLLPVVVGLLAGSYPALYLSRFNPVTVLKGNTSAASFKKSNLRNALVVFQFAASIILIVVTIVIYKQLHFIQTRQLGFNRDQVLIIDGAYALDNNIDAFKQEVLKMPGVSSGTISSFLPVSKSSRNDNSYSKDAVMDSKNGIDMQTWRVDYDYMKTLGIQVINGRNFSKDFGSDSSAMIINETTAKILGYDNPVGQKIYAFKGSTNNQLVAYNIIGVVKNFNYESMHQDVGPLCFLLSKSTGLASFKIDAAKASAIIPEVEHQWKAMASGMPFSYRFLDDSFNDMYRDEQRVGQLAVSFSILAILIACLGLFGLATFMAEQRTKEIGIRKVLGASAGNVVQMLSGGFIKLVLLASLFAFPIAWWAMDKWLQDFAYRISIQWWVFAAAAFAAIMIALITVSYQAIKAALANPVKSLRTE